MVYFLAEVILKPHFLAISSRRTTHVQLNSPGTSKQAQAFPSYLWGAGVGQLLAGTGTSIVLHPHLPKPKHDKLFAGADPGIQEALLHFLSTLYFFYIIKFLVRMSLNDHNRLGYPPKNSKNFKAYSVYLKFAMTKNMQCMSLCHFVLCICICFAQPQQRGPLGSEEKEFR